MKNMSELLPCWNFFFWIHILLALKTQFYDSGAKQSSFLGQQAIHQLLEIPRFTFLINNHDNFILLIFQLNC